MSNTRRYRDVIAIRNGLEERDGGVEVPSFDLHIVICRAAAIYFQAFHPKSNKLMIPTILLIILHDTKQNNTLNSGFYPANIPNSRYLAVRALEGSIPSYYSALKEVPRHSATTDPVFC